MISTTPTHDCFVEVKQLHVTFTGGKKPVQAVSGVDLRVQRGEVVALIGEYGFWQKRHLAQPAWFARCKNHPHHRGHSRRRPTSVAALAKMNLAASVGEWHR